jgi:hypothetical protein
VIWDAECDTGSYGHDRVIGCNVMPLIALASLKIITETKTDRRLIESVSVWIFSLFIYLLTVPVHTFFSLLGMHCYRQDHNTEGTGQPRETSAIRAIQRYL